MSNYRRFGANMAKDNNNIDQRKAADALMHNIATENRHYILKNNEKSSDFYALVYELTSKDTESSAAAPIVPHEDAASDEYVASDEYATVASDEYAAAAGDEGAASDDGAIDDVADPIVRVRTKRLCQPSMSLLHDN